jgi:hypothetical protein
MGFLQGVIHGERVESKIVQQDGFAGIIGFTRKIHPEQAFLNLQSILDILNWIVHVQGGVRGKLHHAYHFASWVGDLCLSSDSEHPIIDSRDSELIEEPENFTSKKETSR